MSHAVIERLSAIHNPYCDVKNTLYKIIVRIAINVNNFRLNAKKRIN